MKLKSFCIAKDTSFGQPIEQEETFTNYTSERELIPKMHKELKKLDIKETTQYRQRILNRGNSNNWETLQEMFNIPSLILFNYIICTVSDIWPLWKGLLTPKGSRPTGWEQQLLLEQLLGWKVLNGSCHKWWIWELSSPTLILQHSLACCSTWAKVGHF